MKIRIFLALLLTGLFALTACQPGPPAAAPTSDPAAEAYPEPTEPPAGVQEASPEPPVEEPGAYPEVPMMPTEEFTGPTGDELYPGIQSGSEVTWDQAVAMIRNGEVASVAQTHELRVTLNLLDGRTFEATQPRIDEIFAVIDACGEVCSDIQIATE